MLLRECYPNLLTPAGKKKWWRFQTFFTHKMNKEGNTPEIFVDKICQDFECIICFQVLRDPRVCKEGHTFCLNCIKQYKTDATRDCPTCNDPIGNVCNMSKTLPLCGIINNLRTFCPSNCEKKENCVNHHESVTCCPWIGPLHARWHHYNQDCDHFAAKCPNTQCDDMVLRKNQSEHLKICQHTLKKCPDCEKNQPVDCKLYSNEELHMHMKVCESMLESCQWCHRKIQRNKLKVHRKLECLDTPVYCPLYRQNLCDKCPQIAARKNIQQHVLEYNHDGLEAVICAQQTHKQQKLIPIMSKSSIKNLKRKSKKRELKKDSIDSTSDNAQVSPVVTAMMSAHSDHLQQAQSSAAATTKSFGESEEPPALTDLNLYPHLPGHDLDLQYRLQGPYWSKPDDWN